MLTGVSTHFEAKDERNSSYRLRLMCCHVNSISTQTCFFVAKLCLKFIMHSHQIKADIQQFENLPADDVKPSIKTKEECFYKKEKLQHREKRTSRRIINK